MVKGISKQVILLRHPDTKLFEQAIFILRENDCIPFLPDKEGKAWIYVSAGYL